MLPALLLAALSFLPEGELFKELTFDQALAAAGQQKKIVMIDFFTTWCAPCKQLDATTWKDPKVLEWAGQKCVALRFDAEKETELAKRFKVGAYPTILLLKADGSEIDRLVGYEDAPTFLADAESALAGKNGIVRAREALVGHETDPMLRGKYANALAMRWRNEEALAEYLWCFDHGNESPAYYGVRLSFLLGDIQRLGSVYPAAIKALEERRDAAEARVVAGSDARDDLVDALNLNGTLQKTSERSLALFDQVRKARPLSPSVRLVFLQELMQPLAAAKRYADLLELTGDPEAWLSDSIKQFGQLNAMSSTQDLEQQQRMLSIFEHRKLSLVGDACTVHEALLGTDRTDEATKLAERLAAFAPAGATWAALIDSAVSAEALDAAKALGENALKALPEKEQGPVRRALKRVDKTEKKK